MLYSFLYSPVWKSQLLRLYSSAAGAGRAFHNSIPLRRGDASGCKTLASWLPAPGAGCWPRTQAGSPDRTRSAAPQHQQQPRPPDAIAAMRQTLLIIAAVWAQEEVLDLYQRSKAAKLKHRVFSWLSRLPATKEFRKMVQESTWLAQMQESPRTPMLRPGATTNLWMSTLCINSCSVRAN